MFKLSILLLALTLVCSENVPQPSNNITSCIEAIKNITTDLMNVIEAIKAFDIGKAFTAMTVLVSNGKKAYNECLGKKDGNLTFNWPAFTRCIASSPSCKGILRELTIYASTGNIKMFLQTISNRPQCGNQCARYS